MKVGPSQLQEAEAEMERLRQVTTDLKRELSDAEKQMSVERCGAEERVNELLRYNR